MRRIRPYLAPAAVIVLILAAWELAASESSECPQPKRSSPERYECALSGP